MLHSCNESICAAGYVGHNISSIGRSGTSSSTRSARRLPSSRAPRVRMNASQLKRFCRDFPHTTERLYGEPYNFLVYSVGGRKFAYFKTSHPERWRFSTRVSPDRFVELTDVPGVKPARWRGRYHWITIVDVSTFPADYLRE